MASESKVTLKSSDDELFDVTEAVAFESQIIKHVIEDTGTANAIPLPNVSSKILSKGIEYCKYHVEAQKSAISEDEIRTWDQAFIKVDQATLGGLIVAADYLDIKALRDLTMQTVADMTVADMIKGKTTEEIRKTFNIMNNFTPEQEEGWVRRANEWAFE